MLIALNRAISVAIAIANFRRWLLVNSNACSQTSAGNRDFSIKTVDAETVCPIREIQETLAIDATDEG